MLYTINLKDNKLEKVDEIFYFEIPNASELIAIGIAIIKYDDKANEYKYFSASGSEMEPELNEWLKTVRDSIMSTYHSLFDKDAVARLKSRKIFNLKAFNHFNDYSDTNCNFMSSFGIMFNGDKQHIDHYMRLLDYYALDKEISVLDVKGNSHDLTRDQLYTLAREALISKEWILRQEQVAIAEIAELTTEEEIEAYIPHIEPYNFFIEHNAEPTAENPLLNINDIEAIIDSELETKSMYNDTILELTDLVYSLQDQIAELKAKLGE